MILPGDMVMNRRPNSAARGALGWRTLLTLFPGGISVKNPVVGHFKCDVVGIVIAREVLSEETLGRQGEIMVMFGHVIGWCIIGDLKRC